MNGEPLNFKINDIAHFGMSCGWVVQDVKLYNGTLYAAVRKETSSIASGQCYFFMYNPDYSGEEKLRVRVVSSSHRSGKAHIWEEDGKVLLTVELAEIYSEGDTIQSFRVTDKQELVEFVPEIRPEMAEFEEDSLPDFYHPILEELHGEETFRHVKSLVTDGKEGVSLFVSSEYETKLFPEVLTNRKSNNNLVFCHFELGKWKTLYVSEGLSGEVTKNLDLKTGEIEFPVQNFGLSITEKKKCVFHLIEEFDGGKKSFKVKPSFKADVATVVFPESKSHFSGQIQVRCDCDNFVVTPARGTVNIFNPERYTRWKYRSKVRQASILIICGSILLFFGISMLRLEPILADLRGNFFATGNVGFNQAVFWISGLVLGGAIVWSFFSIISLFISIKLK